MCSLTVILPLAPLCCVQVWALTAETWFCQYLQSDDKRTFVDWLQEEVGIVRGKSHARAIFIAERRVQYQKLLQQFALEKSGAPVAPVSVSPGRAVGAGTSKDDSISFERFMPSRTPGDTESDRDVALGVAMAEIYGNWTG